MNKKVLTPEQKAMILELLHEIHILQQDVSIKLTQLVDLFEHWGIDLYAE